MTSCLEKIDLENLMFRNQTILAVDDIESNRILLKETLKPYNLNVLEAENGKSDPEQKEDIGLPPLQGTLGVELGFFRYGRFTWRPLRAEVSLSQETVHQIAKFLCLCTRLAQHLGQLLYFGSLFARQALCPLK